MKIPYFKIFYSILLISLQTPTYSQRTIYPFEADYDVKYCVHESLFKSLELQGVYPVAYNQFVSPYAAKKHYTHSIIEEMSNGKVTRKINTYYDINGYITSISTSEGSLSETDLYSYSNENKTIVKSTNGFKQTFYFSNNLLIDSVLTSNIKVIYSYDTAAMVSHIKKTVNGVSEIINLNYHEAATFDPQSIPNISKVMVENGPEFLMSKDSSEKKSIAWYMRYQGKTIIGITVLQGNNMVFMKKSRSSQEGLLDIIEWASFYEWDNDNRLVRYSNYQSDQALKLDFTYGEAFIKKSKKLVVRFFEPNPKIAEYRWAKNTVKLPSKTIIYYK